MKLSISQQGLRLGVSGIRHGPGSGYLRNAGPDFTSRSHGLPVAAVAADVTQTFVGVGSAGAAVLHGPALRAFYDGGRKAGKRWEQ